MLVFSRTVLTHCGPNGHWQSYGCQCWAVLHLLLYTVKWQLTLCFKSLKPIQIGLCMLMYLSIHLHGLHLDAKYGQTTSVNTVTQWRADWSSASVVNHTIVTDLTIRQPDFDLPRRTWSPMNHFRSGQGPCHVNLQHLKVDWIYSTKRICSSHMAGIYNDCNTRNIIIIMTLIVVVRWSYG